jgi:hypothetical protein
MSISIQDAMMNLNGDELTKLAQKLGVSDKTMRQKAHFAAGIERYLTGHLDDFVGKLSETERLWLAESAHAGRCIPDSEFTAKFEQTSPWVRPRETWGYSFNREALFLQAVIYRPDREGPELLPQLIEPLRKLLPKPAARPVQTVAELPLNAHECLGSDHKPLQVFESERIAPAELARVLRLVQAGKLKVTDSTRRPTEASVRAIDAALVVPDFALQPPPEMKREWSEFEKAGPVRAHAWGVLVQQCGWARARDGSLALTPLGQELLQGFSPTKYREGVGRFIKNGDFDELHRVNHIRGQTGKYKSWITDPGRRKQELQSVLSALPVEQWVEFKEARRIAVAFGGDWKVAKGTPNFLYMGDAEYGQMYDAGPVNVQFLRALLMESLATLGLLDIGYVYPHEEGHELRDNWGADQLDFCGRYDGLRFVRLNSLGAYCFGAVETYDVRLEAAPKLFRVLPNLELVLTHGQLDAAHKAMIELVAAPRSDNVWTLDAERMLSHVETGGSLAELKQFLGDNAAEGLPETVQVFLAELERKLGACHQACRAILLEWPDEATARLISTSSGTNKLCHYAGDNRIVVPEPDYRSFTRALKKLGYVAPTKPC